MIDSVQTFFFIFQDISIDDILAFERHLDGLKTILEKNQHASTNKQFLLGRLKKLLI